MRYKGAIHILGLDMSRAFDTIDREKLMEILKAEVQLEEDEFRLCQSLLADTNLKVKLGEAMSDPFQSTIGTPQGDGLSPILFAIYLESALREVRATASEWPRPIEDIGLPLEAIYADDCDFLSTCQHYLQRLEGIIPPKIGARKLIANASKWDRTTLKCGDNKDDKLEWRKTKKLGSLLGDEEDIKRRKSLATASFKSLRLLWERNKVTGIDTRMRVYNALVLPVLLYNCGTWGVTEAVLDKLEVFHRRQLRDILGVKARHIRNEDLYERCNTSPLRRQITYARWSLLGHTLRLTRDTPAQLAMDYYCQVGDRDGTREGRPETTLPVTIFNEYRKYKGRHKERGWTTQKTTADNLAKLRELAGDRQKWRDIVIDICDAEGS